MSTKACSHGKVFAGKPARITFGENKDVMWAHGSNLDCTTILRQPWEELLPWERTQWHSSKHFQFRPIMTVPPKAVFLCTADKLQCWPMLARNGTYWCMLAFSFFHISCIGTIASVVQSSSWHQVRSFENSPWAGLGQILAVACATMLKLSSVYLCLFLWEGFPRQTCINQDALNTNVNSWAFAMGTNTMALIQTS